MRTPDAFVETDGESGMLDVIEREASLRAAFPRARVLTIIRKAVEDGEISDLDVASVLAVEPEIMNIYGLLRDLEKLKTNFIGYLKACENKFIGLGNTNTERQASLEEMFGVAICLMTHAELDGAIVLRLASQSFSDLHTKLGGKGSAAGFVTKDYPEFIFTSTFTGAHVVPHEWQHIVNRFFMPEHLAFESDSLRKALARGKDEIIAYTAEASVPMGLSGALTREDEGSYDYLLPERFTHEVGVRTKLRFLVGFMAEALKNADTKDPRVRGIGLNMLVKQFNINLEEGARIKEAFIHGGDMAAEKAAQRVCLKKPEAKSPVCEAYKFKISQAVSAALEVKSQVDPEIFPQLLAVTPMEHWDALIDRK